MSSLLHLLLTSLILSGSAPISAQSTTNTATSSDDAARAAFIPWSWVIKPDGGQVSCPSASATLGTFAVVNAVVTVLSLFMGNRLLLHYLSGGKLGKPESHSWRYMWLVTFGLQLAANAIVARIYTRSGNEDSPRIWQLVLFFTTRPRLGWLVMNLVSPFYENEPGYDMQDFKYGYYEGNALCLILAELPLQLMSMYYYGLTAHFAAKKHYYIIGNLEGPHAHNAHLMYAGALLALVGGGCSIAGVLLQIARDPELNDSSPPDPGFVFLSLGLMTFGWVGAWLFWAGYVRLAGDLYCPPKLVPSGVIWAIFSTIGSLFGGTF